MRMRWLSLRNRAFDSFSVPAPAGLCLLDSDFRVIRANQTLADMIGVAPKAVVGQGPSCLIPRIAPTVEPILRSVSRTGIPALNFPVSGETPREPGVIRHWIASVFPIRQWGLAGCVGVIVVDVTDQLHFGLLTAAEHLANVGSWEVNVLTGEEIWSPNLRRMLGLGTNHTRQSEDAFWALVHPEDREMVRSIIDWAMKFKHPYEYQTRLVVPNRGERTFFTRGKPVFNSSNCLIKRVGVTQDITERLEMNRAVIESEEKYRDLVEHSHDLICTHDLDGRVLWMNELPARLLGYSAQDLIGHRIPEMLAPETRNLFPDYIDQIQRDGHAEGLMELVARSGERRIWEYRNTLRTMGVPKPIVRGMAHDITERKQAQESLRLFRAQIDGSNDAFEVVDPATLRFLDMNHKGCSDLGYTLDEVRSMSVFDIDPTVDRSVYARVMAEVKKTGSAIKEGIHRRRDGSTFPVEVNLRIIHLDRDYIVAVVRDITARKQSEEALRTQRVLVQGLFETAKILTGTLEVQDILDRLNVQAMALLGAESGCAGLRKEKGFSCDSFFEGRVSKKLNFVWPPGVGIPGSVLQTKEVYLTNDAQHDDLIPPEIREALALRSVLCVPIFDIPHHDVIGFFAMHNKKDGFQKDDVAMAIGMANVASTAIQNALTHRRVSEAEEELRRLSRQLMTSQDDERRKIAYELHEHTAQDLAALTLSLGRLRNSVPGPSRTALDESLTMLRRVFHETRTLSYKLHDSALELAGLRAAMYPYVKTFRERTGIAVNIEIPEDLGRLSHDEETAIYRILQQALSNVHRHSGSNEATIRIHREGEVVLVEIADSGRGMPHGDNAKASAGVGITSMRERAKRLGGSMDIESAPGKGVKIRFRFTARCATTKHAVGGAGHD
jgi:PAS domain S-box-containing protein